MSIVLIGFLRELLINFIDKLGDIPDSGPTSEEIDLVIELLEDLKEDLYG